MSVWHPDSPGPENDWTHSIRLSIADALFDNTNDGVCVTDAFERIVEVNPTFCSLTGYSKQELLGQTPRLLHSGLQNEAFFTDLWRGLRESGQWHGELWNRHKSGRLYAVRVSISAIYNDAGLVSHYLSMISDVTAAKTYQAKLEQSANHDELTGLPNRTLLLDRMQQAMAQATRTNLMLAVCYLDLDGFKHVNDTHGHAAGDAALIEVAKRLSRSVRIGDTVSRVGGDEYLLLLWGLQSREECNNTLARVVADVASIDTLAGVPVTLGISAGISMFPDDGADPDLLIAQADSAMYRSKMAGGNRWRYFNAPQQRASSPA